MPESAEKIRKIPIRLQGTPQLIHLIVEGRAPILDFDELNEMVFALVLYATVALQGAGYRMQAALGHLKGKGRRDEAGPVASSKERQRLVNKPFFDDLEQCYSTSNRQSEPE